MAEPTRSGEDRRPSPKALLELAAKENRGKLKVFLGMAPGVGKTYAMLSAARVQKAEGTDVVVGVVETHGRSETAALLDGLEILPRKPLDYRRRTLMEFDVEAAIRRRPKLVLVDELAHTNVAGSIHAKRWQDVEELQRNGIDVWTTVNIQHLESLQDVVERITGVRVQETVPDKVLETADEIVVVDLPPDDLIQRLKEGKVYLPENARRAIDQFFKPSNLTALRELALRRTADRVDEQMLDQLRQQGIEGPWPTAERILVCVGPDELSEIVVRTAARQATAQKADWIVVNLRPSGAESLDRKAARQVDKHIRLAERLGASSVRLGGQDLTGELLDYAKRNNITQIIVGRSKAGAIDRIRGRSFSRDLVRRAHGLSVLVVVPEEETAQPWLPALSKPSPSAIDALAAVGSVAAAVAIGFALERVTRLPNLSMIFLLAVLICAIRAGLWAAIGAAALSFLAYNFFFIEPRFTFTVAEPYELFSLIMFLVVAVATGTLAGRLRAQAIATRERAEAIQALFDFSAKLAAAPKLDDVIYLLAHQSATAVEGKSIVLMPQAADLEIAGGWPPDDHLTAADWAAARWSHQKREPAGRGTGTLPTARFQFRPMLGSIGPVGVIGIEPGTADEPLPAATDAALQSIIEQAAVATERTRLVARAATAETAAEGERLRAALLSSISHDLRTPLASIVGSVTSLRTLGDRMPRDDRAELLATIEEEAGRLSRFVSNLLDMTRIEAGAIDARRDLVEVADVIRAAAQRAERQLPGAKFILALPDVLPLVRADAGLLDQVLFNLLDNAHKYGRAGAAARVEAATGGSEVRISVTDDGGGIPKKALEKVFMKFYRVSHDDGRPPGTGLGLSICAGLVKAMGGTIKAESPVRHGRGTRMILTLPAAAEAGPAQREDR